MDFAEFHGFYEVHAVSEGGAALGREAYHEVGADMQLVPERRARSLRDLCELLGRVAASHVGQHARVARLERHVQMLAEGGRLRECREQRFVDREGLYRAEAQPL